MTRIDDDWFETAEIGGRRSYYSKFSRSDFTISLTFLEGQWPSWSTEQRARFAGAFGFLQKLQLSDNDQNLLDFLMKNGEPQVWRAIALVVARHRDRRQALNFLVTRVREGARPLANYYQALEKISARECVSVLT